MDVFPRRHIDGQQTPEKVFNIINHQGHANQNHKEISHLSECYHQKDNKLASVSEDVAKREPLEKEMAVHFSVLAWRIPWTEEPGGLPSKGRTESDMTEVT